MAGDLLKGANFSNSENSTVLKPMPSRNLSAVGSPDVCEQAKELVLSATSCQLDTYILPTVRKTSNNKLHFQSPSEVLSTESDHSNHHKEAES